MSKTLKAFFALAFIGLNFNLQSQDVEDPILMEIGERKVNVSEFEAVFKKNNPEINQEALEEYLDLYVNFRLKVSDAEAQGLDTLEKFKRELAGYRRQLASPYLSDNEVTDALIQEAYERMKFEVKASHILVKVGPGAKPADTLLAYRKIESIKKRILKGEDFAKVARETDPDAKGNGGNLGYFSALYMVYPFETAVYNAEVGKVSDPFRTQFGYHVVLVEEKRPNRGEITTAHIMTRISQDGNEANLEVARMKINEIYDKLEAGESFEELALQFSEDKSSASRGGVLAPFTSEKMVEEYSTAAFALENDDDFSKPIKTQYGFHIIKRIKLKELGTFEEMAPELKQKISKDGRSRKSKISFLNKIKKEYGFSENISSRNDFYKVIDSTYFQTEWTADQVSNLEKEMFRLGDSIALQTDFAKYLEANRIVRRPGNIHGFIDRLYAEYKEAFITNYENVRLKSKYPEFRLLMQEYHDGILLFDLTDEKVWSKAIKDSAGLAAFYENHKSENMWETRLEGVVYNCLDEITAKSVKKLVKARGKKDYADKDILEMTNETSQLNLELERGKFSKEDNSIVDEISWEKGISDFINRDNRVYFVEVIDILLPQPKELNEVKGIMTSEYQNLLEQEWLNELREKYPVKIYKEHLSQIK